MSTHPSSKSFIYFGDLHTHNNVGYGPQGLHSSPRGRTHLLPDHAGVSGRRIPLRSDGLNRQSHRIPGRLRRRIGSNHRPQLTREALFDAFRKRHTYAVTGDRIWLDFRINGRMMGEETPYRRKRKISLRAPGWNWIDRVEVLKNNRVIYRDFPVDKEPGPDLWKRPLLIKIEYGWGPMLMHKDPLAYVPPVCDWDMNVSFNRSKITDIHPCFQSIPFDEMRRHALSKRTDRSFHLTSYTARRRSYEHCDTSAVILKINGSPRDELKIVLKKPQKKIARVRLAELLKDDCAILMERPPRPLLKWGQSVRISRIIPEANVTAELSLTDEGSGRQVDWYYVRVIEKNGHHAWSSPIWGG